MATGKADAKATFQVDLVDGTSGPAASAAKALEQLQRQIEGDQKALAAMQKAMRNLQGGGAKFAEDVKKLKTAIEAKKAAIAQSQASFIALGGKLGDFKKKSPKSMFDELRTAAGQLPGPLGGLTSSLGKMKEFFAANALAIGIAAVAAGLLALAAAAAAATVALLKYGIAQASARRNELLRLEGLTKMRNWYGIAAGNAGEMQSAIDRVSGATALGRDKLEQYTSQLYRMGLRGENLGLALEAAAIKGAVLGDEGAKSAMGWAAGLAMTGKSVRALTDDIKARFGGIAAKQLLDLDVQAQKMRESFGVLFRDLKIEGLLKAVQTITSLFSQSTASGRALKAIAEAVFQPMINAVETLTPLVRRFFQGMIIGALEIGIVLLKVRNWFKRTFGDSEILKGINLQTLAVRLGIVAVFGLAAVFGVLAAALSIAAGNVLLIYTAFGLLLSGIVALVKKAWNYDWKSLGKSIVDGIVGGLKGGAKWVIDAVKNLGDASWKAFKSKLGIASPSKEFAKLGLAIPQGVEKGVNAGAPSVQGAVSDMVDVPKGGAARAGGSSTAVSIGEVHVHTIGTTAGEIARDFRRELEKVLKEVALTMGASAPGGA